MSVKMGLVRFLGVVILALPLIAAAKCPTGSDGSSSFDKAREILSDKNEILTDSSNMIGTWGAGSAAQPARVKLTNSNSKLNITIVTDEGTPKEKKLGP